MEPLRWVLASGSPRRQVLMQTNLKNFLFGGVEEDSFLLKYLM
jgi:predicted house-cleaning NTP pyrophosphatase (Maf/HAM1 superfamily)